MQITAIAPYSIGNYHRTNSVQENNLLNSCHVNTQKSETQKVYANNVYGINFGNAAGAITRNFEKEIAQQPDVLRKLSEKFFQYRNSVNIDLNISPEEMAKIKRISIIASGSSKNAGEMAAGFIQDVTSIPVNVISASEYMCQKIPVNHRDDLAILISQSGRTADTIKALEKVKGAGVKTIAITNNPDSKIAKTADSHVDIEAGEEKAVAATKTVTASIYSLMATGLKLAEIKGSLGFPEFNKHANALKILPDKVSRMIHDTADVKKAADIIADSENIYYYAKGTNVGAAREGALKLSETTGKRVIADSSSEALHGTFASIQPNNPVLQVVIGKYGDENYRISLQNIDEMIRKRHIQHPIVIKNSSDDIAEKLLGNPDIIYIGIPQSKEAVTPLLTTVRFQQITNEVTKKLEINPDNGRDFLTKFRPDISM